jgi:hypothetical protein
MLQLNSSKQQQQQQQQHQEDNTNENRMLWCNVDDGISIGGKCYLRNPDDQTAGGIIALLMYLYKPSLMRQ